MVVHFAKDRGPYFAYSINIFNDFLDSEKNVTRTLNDIKDNWYGFSSDYELNGNKEYLDIKEIEVFEVLISN